MLPELGLLPVALDGFQHPAHLLHIVLQVAHSVLQRDDRLLHLLHSHRRHRCVHELLPFRLCTRALLSLAQLDVTNGARRGIRRWRPTWARLCICFVAATACS